MRGWKREIALGLQFSLILKGLRLVQPAQVAQVGESAVFPDTEGIETHPSSC